MSSKESKPKTATKTATQKQAAPEKVVAVPTANTIVEKKMEGEVVAVEKKGKKGGAKEAAPAPTPVPVQAVEPVAEKKGKKGGVKEVVQAAPVPTPVQAAGTKGKAKAQPKVEAKVEPVVEAKQEKKTKKGGAKEVAQPVVQAVAPAEAKQEKKTKKGGAKEAAPVQPAVAQPVVQAGGAAAADEEEEAAGTKLRYFKLIYNEEVQGRYCGKKPKQAANKAFSSIIKDLKKSGQQNGGVNVDINFTIRECTRNSKHKEYKYIGKRQVLNNPVQVKIANADGSVKEIEYKFHNKLQKAPKA